MKYRIGNWSSHEKFYLEPYYIYYTCIYSDIENRWVNYRENAVWKGRYM